MESNCKMLSTRQRSTVEEKLEVIVFTSVMVNIFQEQKGNSIFHESRSERGTINTRNLLNSREVGQTHPRRLSKVVMPPNPTNCNRLGENAQMRNIQTGYMNSKAKSVINQCYATPSECRMLVMYTNALTYRISLLNLQNSNMLNTTHTVIQGMKW